jgi:hypothetical protein
MKLQSVTITWSPAPRKFWAGAALALALDFFFFLGSGVKDHILTLFTLYLQVTCISVT